VERLKQAFFVTAEMWASVSLILVQAGEPDKTTGQTSIWPVFFQQGFYLRKITTT